MQRVKKIGQNLKKNLAKENFDSQKIMQYASMVKALIVTMQGEF
jgi:hypothetical protein